MFELAVKLKDKKWQVKRQTRVNSRGPRRTGTRVVLLLLLLWGSLDRPRLCGAIRSSSPAVVALTRALRVLGHGLAVQFGGRRGGGGGGG